MFWFLRLNQIKMQFSNTFTANQKTKMNLKVKNFKIGILVDNES